MHPLSDFVAGAHGASLDEFRAAHPHPFLLLETATAEPVPDTGFQTLGGGPVALADGPPAPDKPTKAHQRGGPPPPSTVRDLIVAVAKGSGTPFPGMITVGRARNNDLVLKFQHVSKFHAYFTREPDGRYTLTDAGSTNGTSINKRALGEGEKVLLADGDTVNFGGDLPLTFMLPTSLHRYLPVLARRLAERAREP